MPLLGHAVTLCKSCSQHFAASLKDVVGQNSTDGLAAGPADRLEWKCRKERYKKTRMNKHTQGKRSRTKRANIVTKTYIKWKVTDRTQTIIY